MTSPARPLRLGTRRSRLATTQSEWVADLLRARGHEVEIVTIVTEGDVSSAPLTQIGGTGVFASAIRTALHEGRVDFAVHSLKDLPVLPEPGLVIAATPVREDPRDALCARDGRTLEDLPDGARIGTGSPRRAAQLRVRRPDLQIVPLRGNVETRLGAVAQERVDAVVLAYAGLARLGMQEHVTQVLPASAMLPAPGQGALAVECRDDRPGLVETLAAVDDATTRRATGAERALLRALEAGCTAPIGALAVPSGSHGTGDLLLSAFAGTDEGDLAFRDELSGPGTDAAGLGRELARRLLAAGADRIASRPGSGLQASATTASEPPGASKRAATSEKIQECPT